MANLGFVGLGVMGSQMVNRLLSKGHTVTGLQPHSNKGAVADRQRNELGGFSTRRLRCRRFYFRHGHEFRGDCFHHRRTRWTARWSERRQDIHRYEYGQSHRQPRSRRQSARKGRGHGGLAGIRERDHFAGRQAIRDGRPGVARLSSGFCPRSWTLPGPKVTRVGDNGLALAMKIAVNLSLAVQMMAFSEGVLLAEKSGISRETAVDVLTHGAVAIARRMIQCRGPFVTAATARRPGST